MQDPSLLNLLISILWRPVAQATIADGGDRAPVIHPCKMDQDAMKNTVSAEERAQGAQGQAWEEDLRRSGSGEADQLAKPLRRVMIALRAV